MAAGPLVAAACVALLLGFGFARRLAVITEYRNFAGDGWQYYHLAEELVSHHRYALGPAPLPPAWSRLPGYPLFVAVTGYPAPRFNDADVASRVTHSQVFLDLGTAIATFLLCAHLGLRGPRFLALALCVASPLLAICVSYVLSETLAIFLSTLTIWLLARACRGRLLLHYGLAGAALGLGLLVRADTITLAPAFAVPLLFCRATPTDKLRAIVTSIIACALVFSPWPIRNVMRFGAPHPLGSPWVTKTGDALPMGLQSWLLTWAVDPQAATVEVAWKMTRATPVYAFSLPPEAFDSPAERKRVGDLFDAYDRDGLIAPAVDEGFRALAAERRSRDPFRYFVKLPLRRARELWLEPVPEWELPIQSTTLDLPARRAALGPHTRRTLLLACAGLLLSLFLRRGRPLALLFLTCALARTAAIVFVVPGGTERYAFELLPLLYLFAAVALVAPAELLLYRLFPRLRPA